MFWDDPPHAVDTYTVASSIDPGAGTALTYTLADSAVPCLINTSSSSERDEFGQAQQVTSHVVSFLTSALTTPLTRGMKLVATDYGVTLIVQGISAGRAVGGIPAFTYAHCSSLN